MFTKLVRWIILIDAHSRIAEVYFWWQHEGSKQALNGLCGSLYGSCDCIACPKLGSGILARRWSPLLNMQDRERRGIDRGRDLFSRACYKRERPRERKDKGE